MTGESLGDGYLHGFMFVYYDLKEKFDDLGTLPL